MTHPLPKCLECCFQPATKNELDEHCCCDEEQIDCNGAYHDIEENRCAGYCNDCNTSFCVCFNTHCCCPSVPPNCPKGDVHFDKTCRKSIDCVNDFGYILRKLKHVIKDSDSVASVYKDKNTEERAIDIDEQDRFVVKGIWNGKLLPKIYNIDW